MNNHKSEAEQYKSLDDVLGRWFVRGEVKWISPYEEDTGKRMKVRVNEMPLVLKRERETSYEDAMNNTQCYRWIWMCSCSWMYIENKTQRYTHTYKKNVCVRRKVTCVLCLVSSRVLVTMVKWMSAQQTNKRTRRERKKKTTTTITMT